MENLVFYLILGFISVVLFFILTYAYWSHQYWITYGFQQIQPDLFYGNRKPYLRHNLNFGTMLRNYYKESEFLKYVGLYIWYINQHFYCAILTSYISFCRQILLIFARGIFTRHKKNVRC